MISVTVKINNAQVTLEGPEDFVREEVRHLTSRLAGPSNAGAEGEKNSAPGENAGDLTEARIVEDKKPSNHPEIIAVLAYHLKQNGTEEFSEEDIRRAYIRAKVRPPKVVAQAIRDAKNAYDFVANGSGRGLYRLSNHGERTVIFDLPRS